MCRVVTRQCGAGGTRQRFGRGKLVARVPPQVALRQWARRGCQWGRKNCAKLCKCDARAPHAPSSSEDEGPATPRTPRSDDDQRLFSSSRTTFLAEACRGAGGLNAESIHLPSPKAIAAATSTSLRDLPVIHHGRGSVRSEPRGGFTLRQHQFRRSITTSTAAPGALRPTRSGEELGVTWEPPWGQIRPPPMSRTGQPGAPHSGWLYPSCDSPWDTTSSIRSASSGVLARISHCNSSNATSIFAISRATDTSRESRLLGGFRRQPDERAATTLPGTLGRTP